MATASWNTTDEQLLGPNPTVCAIDPACRSYRRPFVVHQGCPALRCTLNTYPPILFSSACLSLALHSLGSLVFLLPWPATVDRAFFGPCVCLLLPARAPCIHPYLLDVAGTTSHHRNRLPSSGDSSLLGLPCRYVDAVWDRLWRTTLVGTTFVTTCLAEAEPIKSRLQRTILQHGPLPR